MIWSEKLHNVDKPTHTYLVRNRRQPRNPWQNRNKCLFVMCIKRETFSIKWILINAKTNKQKRNKKYKLLSYCKQIIWIFPYFVLFFFIFTLLCALLSIIYNIFFVRFGKIYWTFTVWSDCQQFNVKFLGIYFFAMPVLGYWFVIGIMFFLLFY